MDGKSPEGIGGAVKWGLLQRGKNKRSAAWIEIRSIDGKIRLTAVVLGY